MKLRPLCSLASLSVLALWSLGTASCRTTNSSGTKDLPIGQISTLTLDQWVTACKAELANPTTGATSLADLQQLANTTDCATAYPIIKNVISQYATKS